MKAKNDGSGQACFSKEIAIVENEDHYCRFR